MSFDRSVKRTVVHSLVAYGASYGAVPTSAASMAATSGAYADYSQMSAASQMPTAAGPGAQPRLEAPAATDYSAYGEKPFTVCCVTSRGSHDKPFTVCVTSRGSHDKLLKCISNPFDILQLFTC